MPQSPFAITPSTFPELYERWLVTPIFRPWAEVLLQRVALAPGDRLLDVACGTGIVARLARKRLGEDARVCGVDPNPHMLQVARAIAPGIDWREGSAVSLPVAPDETFDVVVCQQGLQFVPDRPAAAREMRRVLVPEGRLGVATWRPLEEVPFFLALRDVAQRHLGPVVDQRHAFGDTEALGALLREAGFRDVRVEALTLPAKFSGDPAMFLRLNTLALLGMSEAGKAMSDADRARIAEAIVSDSSDVLQAHTHDGVLTFDLGSSIATARA